MDSTGEYYGSDSHLVQGKKMQKVMSLILMALLYFWVNDVFGPDEKSEI